MYGISKGLSGESIEIRQNQHVDIDIWVDWLCRWSHGAWSAIELGVFCTFDTMLHSVWVDCQQGI